MLSADIEKAATTANERKLAGVFAEILGKPSESLCINHSFFALGGHSLLTVKLMQRINATFDVDIQVNDIFIYPSIEELITLIEERVLLDATSQSPAITATKNIMSGPLSFAQQRLWFIEQLQLETLNALHTIIVGGEACDQTIVEQWANRVALFNAYGPTEASICHSVACLHAGTTVTLGHAIANNQSFVLDANGYPVPEGCVGELYISGVGLAHGYIGQGSLTAERFVSIPFKVSEASTESSPTISVRSYRTGDLVKRHKNGELQFVGRNDDQVKIRGFRIELGEIENHMLDLQEIDKCIVVAHQYANGSQGLQGFVSGVASLTSEGVLQALRKKIPSYLIPDSINVVEHWPVTAHGKLDKKALTTRIQETEVGNTPSTEIERELAKVWSRLLNLPVEQPYQTHNFFTLGGHSLLAVKLQHDINEQFHTKITVRDIFEYATLEQLSLKIGEQQQMKTPSQSLWNPLIVNQQRKQGLPNVFVMPGAGMLPSSVFGLAQPLADIANVVVIESKGIDGQQPAFTSFNEEVSSIVNAITQHQPKGPYILIGHSVGGSYQFEIANRLQTQKQKVGLLLLDALVRKPAEFAPLTEHDYLTNLANAWQVQVSNDDIATALVEHLATENIMSKADAAQFLPAFVKSFLRQQKWFMAYQPTHQFTGPVALLAAARGAFTGHSAERVRSIQAWCTQPLQVGLIGATHMKMLDAKHVGKGIGVELGWLFKQLHVVEAKIVHYGV